MRFNNISTSLSWLFSLSSATSLVFLTNKSPKKLTIMKNTWRSSPTANWEFLFCLFSLYLYFALYMRLWTSQTVSANSCKLAKCPRSTSLLFLPTLRLELCFWPDSCLIKRELLDSGFLLGAITWLQRGQHLRWPKIRRIRNTCFKFV